MSQEDDPPFDLSSNLKETVTEGDDLLIEEIGDSARITKLRRGLKKIWRDRYALVISTTSEEGKLKLSIRHAEYDAPRED